MSGSAWHARRGVGRGPGAVAGKRRWPLGVSTGVRDSSTCEGVGDPLGTWEMSTKPEAALKQMPNWALACDLRSVMKAGALLEKIGPQALMIGGPG